MMGKLVMTVLAITLAVLASLYLDNLGVPRWFTFLLAVLLGSWGMFVGAMIDGFREYR